MLTQLRTFARYAFRHGRGILFAILLLLGDVAITTLMPALMSRIVDHGVLAGRMDVIRDTGLTMTLAALAGSVIGLLFSIVTSVLAQRISNDMRKDLFFHIL